MKKTISELSTTADIFSFISDSFDGVDSTRNIPTVSNGGLNFVAVPSDIFSFSEAELSKPVCPAISDQAKKVSVRAAPSASCQSTTAEPMLLEEKLRFLLVRYIFTHRNTGVSITDLENHAQRLGYGSISSLQCRLAARDAAAIARQSPWWAGRGL